ncbi:MAG: sugar ABC transporter ATP-binding protein, partial [Caldilineaceae bacterium]|nr:sugar ABC transporter ATP-binding protein [Caldilineaceae bacterium]
QYGAQRRERAITVEPQPDRREALLEKARTEQTPVTPIHAAKQAAAQVVYRCRELAKSYGTVTAAYNVGFAINAGEVVCLVGDNGAGKSTVIKMISGAVQPDRGETELLGKPVTFTSPFDARAAGVETVYQDLALCANLGAAHNMVLGKEPTRTRWGPLSLRDGRAGQEIARDRLLELNIALEDYDRPVGSLSGGQRQSVAIARTVTDDVVLAILDEPTAALGVAQTRNVLHLIRTLA